jgi:hexokinase
MAFSEFLADRVAQFFNEKSIPFEAKKMMGGLCFMIDGKMCVGIN